MACLSFMCGLYIPAQDSSAWAELPTVKSMLVITDKRVSACENMSHIEWVDTSLLTVQVECRVPPSLASGKIRENIIFLGKFASKSQWILSGHVSGNPESVNSHVSTKKLENFGLNPLQLRGVCNMFNMCFQMRKLSIISGMYNEGMTHSAKIKENRPIFAHQLPSQVTWSLNWRESPR